MADTTGRLLLPYIMQSQSQKEVTHNEALNLLDVLIHPVAQEVGLDTPPGSPAAGQCWVVGASPTGAWAGKADYIAQAAEGGGWYFVAPFKRLRLWNESADAYYVYDGVAWMPDGLILKETGEYLRVEHQSEDIAVSGVFTDSAMGIPDRAILLCVNVRVISTVTGAASFDVGVSGETDKFGGSIGVVLDSANTGVIAPTAYYAATPIRLTANGGDFTGGTVRASMQYLKPRGPWTW